MPVNYVAPGPISMAGIYGRNRGGDGGGGGIVQLHDDSMRQQNQLALAGLQGTIENDQINQRGQIQAQLGQQAAQLDVWQYQQKVTEQEAMQLRQDQNAISAIDADPSMSPMEKQQAKLRIKTRIDWVSERQKRDMQQAQVELYQSHAKQYGQQVELDQARLKRSAGNLEDNIRFVLDPTAKALLEQEVSALDPGLKEVNPAAFDKKVFEMGEQRKAGWFKLQQPDGKWEPLEKEGTGSKAGAKKEAAPKPFNKTSALSAARGLAKDAEGLTEGTPEYSARVKELYEEQKKEHEDANTPPEVKKKQAVQKEMETNVQHFGTIRDSDRLTGEQKQAALFATTRMNQIIEKFGPYDTLSPELKKQVDGMASTILKAKQIAVPRGE